MRVRSVFAWAAAAAGALAFAAGIAAGAAHGPGRVAAGTSAGASFPIHVAVSLTRIPGNACCLRFARASVSAAGVLSTATASRDQHWRPSARRTLSRTELRALQAQLGRFDPSTLRASGPACHHLPIGDVGGYDLRVGAHESNCPPPAAGPLIRLLTRYLPRG